jgi:hypothetical protein
MAVPIGQLEQPRPDWVVATPGCHHRGNHMRKFVLPSIGTRCTQGVRMEYINVL